MHSLWHFFPSRVSVRTMDGGLGVAALAILSRKEVWGGTGRSDCEMAQGMQRSEDCGRREVASPRSSLAPSMPSLLSTNSLY